MERLRIVLNSPGDIQVALFSAKPTLAAQGRRVRSTNLALIGFQTLKWLTKSQTLRGRLKAIGRSLA